MKYEIRQVVAQFTHIEADDEDEALEMFRSMAIDSIGTDYYGDPSIKEIDDD